MRRCQRSSVSGRTRKPTIGPVGAAGSTPQQRPVGRLQPGPWMLAAQHRKLVAQHQDLDLLGLLRPKAEQDQLQAAAQRQVDERPDHETSTGEGEQATAHRNLVIRRYLLVTAMIDFWHPTRLTWRRSTRSWLRRTAISTSLVCSLRRHSQQHADKPACHEVEEGQGHRPIVSDPDHRCSAHWPRSLNPTGSWHRPLALTVGPVA